MFHQLERCAVVGAVLIALGCSEAPLEQGGPSGGAGGVAGSGGSGNAAGGGSVPGGGAAGMTGGAPAGGAMPCSSYADAPTWSLVVQIKNETSEALYLGQETSSCEAQSLFEVEDGSGTPLPPLQSCRNSCQAVMATGPVTCPAACATPSTVTLEPGQTVKVPWDGRFGVQHSLPQECLAAGPTGSSSCVRAERVEANAYTFLARAGTRRQCLDPSGSCTCTPSAIGGCTAAGSLIAGTIITTELFMKLEPGEPATSGEPPFIGLVFKP